MPIYEYRCTACGKIEEAIQKVSDAPLITCPHCGQETLQKNISAAGFQLSGSGWYASGYQNQSTTPTENAPANKAETKTETKAATTTETTAAPKPRAAKTTE